MSESKHLRYRRLENGLFASNDDREVAKDATATIIHEAGLQESALISEVQTIKILNGNRFMITSRSGDISSEEHGVFRDDTRMLSLYELRLNGRKPLTLTSNNTTHYSAGFYLTNTDLSYGRARAKGDEIANLHNVEKGIFDQEITKGKITIHRMSFIERDVREDIYIRNSLERAAAVTLNFRLNADFVDLFEVKERVFGKALRTALGRDSSTSNNTGQLASQFNERENAFDFRYNNRNTWVQSTDSGLVFF